MPSSGRGLCVCRCGRSAVLASASYLPDGWGSTHVLCVSISWTSPRWPPSLVQTTVPPPRWWDWQVCTLSQDSVLHMRLQRLSGHCLP